jgi:hypothetical protein
MGMVLGVIGMKKTRNLDVLITVARLKETWVWQRITAATAEGEVVLFHLPLLPNHQSLQRSQLLRQRYVLTRPTGRMDMARGVIGMKKMMNLDVFYLVLCLMEAWVWQRITAATAEGEVILFHLLPRQQSQALQRSQLLRQRYVLTRPTGWIVLVLGVIGMKKMMNLDVLNSVVGMKEAWVRHWITAATAEEGVTLVRLPLL